MLTIVQPDIGSTSSESLFSSEPTEGIQAVIEVYVNDRFSELDRALNESAAIVRRPVADGERSAIDPLRINDQDIRIPFRGL